MDEKNFVGAIGGRFGGMGVKKLSPERQGALPRLAPVGGSGS